MRLSRIPLLALPLVALLAMLPASGQPPAAPQPMPKAHPRGHVPPTDAYRKAVHDEAFKRHGTKVSALPTATPAVFDCRTQGWVGPIDDQGNCGSCWDVATFDQITNAYIRAGLFKPGQRVSPQYILDGCGPQNGGCDGDWGTTVLRHAKAVGVPLASDYGPYTARPGTCRFKDGTKLYTIQDWGFCTPAQEEGMSTTQDIKNAILAYGSVSTAIAANSDWDNVGTGAMPYRRLTANDVNHEVQISGWDDAVAVPGTSARGAFLVRNQWGTGWGNKGYALVGYGSHQIGTEATWVKLDAPTPVPPVPPGPPPPTPPVPGKAFTGTETTTWVNGAKIGPTVSTSATADVPTPELGKEYTIDLSRYSDRPFIQGRIKHRVKAQFEDVPGIVVTDNGDSLTITPKGTVKDGKLTAPDWQAFFDFIVKMIPLILQIIAAFGHALPGDIDPMGLLMPTDAPTWHAVAGCFWHLAV